MESSSHVLTFGTPPDDFPLRERIVLHDSIAFRESQLGTSDVSRDADFLKQLPKINCWYGACDCQLYPFICVPEIPFTSVPTAKSVLGELRASYFKSDHIASLDASSIPYPGYRPGTDNDEIHTDSDKQSIFPKPEDQEEEEDWAAVSPADSIRWHEELRRYVLDGHVFYVLLHTKPHPYGEFEFSEWVILFAVGVSPDTGNLVGAITHQACHNYCD